jgi:glutathione S-transferase
MLRLYIGNRNYSSWSLRPWIALREAAVPFEERLVFFVPGGSSREFRRFSPSGRVPCLLDGEITVWDSLAIVEHLAERQPALWPDARTARAWARSASAEMHSGFQVLRSRCPMSCGVRVRLTARPPELEADLARLAELWSEGLGRFGGPYLAGSRFTAVDAFYAPVCFRAQTYGLLFPEPAMDWIARMLALPSMREWYEAALAEPVREAGHEHDVLAAGTLIEDLRRPAAPTGA